jgi:hypothetical protein
MTDHLHDLQLEAGVEPSSTLIRLWSVTVTVLVISTYLCVRNY